MRVEDMEPGRELDALVAERVMGLVPCQNECHKSDDPNDRALWPCHAKPDSPRRGGETACYSTDIAAAWEVVEAMRHWPTPYHVTIEDDGTPEPGLWSVNIQGEGWTRGNWYSAGHAEKPTVPHAACIAALLALGVAEMPDD